MATITNELIPGEFYIIRYHEGEGEFAQHLFVVNTLTNHIEAVERFHSETFMIEREGIQDIIHLPAANVPGVDAYDRLKEMAVSLIDVGDIGPGMEMLHQLEALNHHYKIEEDEQ